MLSYRLFQLQLLFHLFSLNIVNIFLTLKKRSSFIAITLLFTMSAGIFLNQLTNNPATTPKNTVSAARPQFPSNTNSAEKQELSTSKINSRLQKVEKALSLQPTHFSLLINAALLHQAQGNTEEASKYFSRAQEVNPNHQYFR